MAWHQEYGKDIQNLVEEQLDAWQTQEFEQALKNGLEVWFSENNIMSNNNNIETEKVKEVKQGD